MTTEEAGDLVDATKWYHAWEIVPGVHTPGRCPVDPKQVLDLYGVPERLDGLRALDIGAWDGAYSFELERRGAEVVSLDIKDPNETGYNTAKKILGSKCQHVRCSVYNLGPDRVLWANTNGIPPDVEKCGLIHADYFDLVLYLGVFYHLTNPMLAWERIKSVMKPDATLYFEGLVFDCAWLSDLRLMHRREQIEAVRDLPIAYFAEGEYAYDGENWYVPTTTCLYGWLVAAGYRVVNMGVAPNASRVYGAAKIQGKSMN